MPYLEARRMLEICSFERSLISVRIRDTSPFSLRCPGLMSPGGVCNLRPTTGRGGGRGPSYSTRTPSVTLHTSSLRPNCAADLARRLVPNAVNPTKITETRFIASLNRPRRTVLDRKSYN
ncbi:hypothetical protein J6590_016942 [Homalodisca vitripennis]|nr:hypothetical protein J6590_016942 [Homalodisca vitripennis]